MRLYDSGALATWSIKGDSVFRNTLGMRLRGAYLTFHRRANAHFERSGVTADQFVVLTVLAEEEGLTQRDVMERVFSDPNTVGEMLRRLEARKLVQRKPHPRDRRARCVFLTAKGRAFQRRLHDDSQAFHRQFEDTFSAAERTVLSEMLGRIPAAMESVQLAASEAVA